MEAMDSESVLVTNMDSLNRKIFAKLSFVHWPLPSMAGSPWPSAKGFVVEEPDEGAAQLEVS